MFYNLANEFEKNKALTKLESLIKKGAIIELTEKKERSLNLNAYMHVCFGIVGLELGYNIDDVKTMLFKLTLFNEYYDKGVKEVFGKKKRVVLSTKETPHDVLCEQVDLFRNYCIGELGIYIPSPEEHKALKQAEVLINNNKNYL